MTLITYLVEDNQTILDNLIETLQEVADVTVTAHSATQTEATRWLMVHDGHWHLAIVDLFLKEGTGLGVLAGCRQREAHQKVVVLTNYATDEIRQRAAELGADAVFDKSNELDALFSYCIEQTDNLKRRTFRASDRSAHTALQSPRRSH
ncbi:MAG: response regulator [Polaromonas sp.]